MFQELRRTGRKQLRFSSIEEQRESTGTDDVKENLKIEVKKGVEEDCEQQSDTDDIAQVFLLFLEKSKFLNLENYFKRQIFSESKRIARI